jgi:hypothetical protein
MSDILISYKDFSYEENPQIITWLQMFLIKYYENSHESLMFLDELSSEWKVNSQIDIYKYIIPDDSSFAKEKQVELIHFLEQALTFLITLNYDQLSKYINSDVLSQRNFERIKENLIKHINLVS